MRCSSAAVDDRATCTEAVESLFCSLRGFLMNDSCAGASTAFLASDASSRARRSALLEVACNASACAEFATGI